MQPNLPPFPEPEPPWPDAPPLDTALADLGAWWLHVRCGCRGSNYLPLGVLAAQKGWTMNLGELVPALRCDRCGEKPKEIALIDDPAAGARGTGGHAQKRIVIATTG